MASGRPRSPERTSASARKASRASCTERCRDSRPRWRSDARPLRDGPGGRMACAGGPRDTQLDRGGCDMARMVKCVKLQKELPGLEYRPSNNELGQRIYDNVSQEAWKMWLEHFKENLNENRPVARSEEGHKVLFGQADQYLFRRRAAPPPAFRAPPPER